MIGTIWFAAASLLCGAAPNVDVLIGARVLQGIGAALLTPGSLAILQAMQQLCGPLPSHNLVRLPRSDEPPHDGQKHFMKGMIHVSTLSDIIALGAP